MTIYDFVDITSYQYISLNIVIIYVFLYVDNYIANYPNIIIKNPIEIRIFLK